MEVFFWACLGLIAYTYLIYPALVIVLAWLFPSQPEVDESYLPSVSMVIPAYNEEEVLEEKIQNCLAIDYPREKIEFLIGSDGSDDGTNTILSNWDKPEIRSFVYSERRGKTEILNRLVPKAQGQVIIFSDANSIYQPQTVKCLVRYFHQGEIGGVCGKLTLKNPAGGAGGKGEGLYWRYENKIKEAEGRLGSVISANGAIFAVRKKHFKELLTRRPINDDLAITLDLLKEKSRVVYEPQAAAAECTSPDMGGEFVRKIRIATLNFNSLRQALRLLHPKYGFTALAIFSHKLLRWAVPLLAAGMLVSNLALVGSNELYRHTLAGQAAVYLGAFMGFIGDRFFKRSGPFLPLYYLAMINVAIVIGFWRSISNQQEGAWKRVPR